VDIPKHTRPKISRSGNPATILRIRPERSVLWRTYGENIAAGNPTVSSVIRRELVNERHCRNVLNPASTEIGNDLHFGQKPTPKAGGQDYFVRQPGMRAIK